MTTLLLILSLLAAMMVGSAVSADDSQQQATFATPRLVVNASFLNIRTGPGTQYSVLATAVGGMELPVLGVAHDLVWYQVATNAGVGWVNVEFTLARGDFTRVPFAEAAPPLIIQPQVVVVNPASLGQGGGVAAPQQAVVSPGNSPTGRVTGVSITGGDLREAPGETANIAPGLVNDMNTVYAVSNAVNLKGEVWYQITIPDVGTGWVSKAIQRPIACRSDDFIVVMTVQNSGVAVGSEGYVVGVRGDFFTLMFTDGSTRTVAAQATVARSEDVKSICNGVVSAPGAVVNPATVATFPIPVQAPNHIIVNTGRLNVRSGPGGNFSVFAQVTGGVELAILGTAPDNEWFLVQGYFGQGWVDSEFVIFRGDFSVVPIIRDAYSASPIIVASVLSPAQVSLGQGGGVAAPVVTAPQAVAATGNVVIVNTGNLNVRSGPGGNFGILAAVPGGTQLPALGISRDNAWFLVQVGSGQGWVSVEFVVFRGNIDGVPIIG